MQEQNSKFGGYENMNMSRGDGGMGGGHSQSMGNMIQNDGPNQSHDDPQQILLEKLQKQQLEMKERQQLLVFYQ